VLDALVRYMRAGPRETRRSVLRSFVSMARERLGLLDVEITSPAPLSPEQVSALSGRAGRIFGKRPVITLKIDASLLGGVRVIAGNRLLDDSIKSGISRLKQALLEKVVNGDE
jgi:F0F1-type ATP synthase delta subunit